MNANKDRNEYILDGLPLEMPGLEISPLYRPIAYKSKHNVYYTDYVSSEESRIKHSHYQHDEIVDIDFIWEPNKRLVECMPENLRFNWAVASHVFEHVPDPIGWILEVFETLNDGSIFSLAQPSKYYCFDRIRKNTEVSDLISLWLDKQKIPSTSQLYDFLSNSTSDEYSMAGDASRDHDDFKRHYTKQQALEFVINAWENGTYFDAHCSVFTPDSLYNILNEINDIGLINATISDPIDNKGEFYIRIIKNGIPRVQHPGMSFKDKNILNNTDYSEKYSNDLTHARNAFSEAVIAQNVLKSKIEILEHKRFSLLRNFFRR